MDVTREDVLRCARLADLRLEEAEVEPMRQAMEQLLTHAQSLDALDLADVEPTFHALPMALPRREDVPGESLSQAEALGNAPDADQGHFRVPKAR
jgi:aspartyl-tRNA(Asn)/glutamyl-tRNA(Gln) amidotransferase subunit C